MNFPDHLLPVFWVWLSQALYFPVLIWASATAPWRRFRDEAQLHLWLGSCVGLMLAWCFLRTGIKPGLNFHVLGATLLTLMFGPRLAIAGLSLVLLGASFFGFSGWESFSANALLMGVLPVAVSHVVYRLVENWLPGHFFIYIFLCAFAGAALAMAATGLAITALLAAAGVYPLDYLTSQYLPYFILMSWSEALLTGMLTTLLVVYRPQWVATFDDARHLRGK